MGFDSNGMRSALAPDDQWLDVFALVMYIPDPLGQFLDDLRRELVPGCSPHAHVSVLPPREIPNGWEDAREQARSLLEAWPPFEIAATDVSRFPATDVIYIEVGAGATDLRRMHQSMNSNCLHCCERFDYHPHITLAQEIPDGRVAEVHELARRRWAEYRGPRSFTADRAVFVRNTRLNRWIDLAELTLGTVAAERR
jgi:hypothetical protein